MVYDPDNYDADNDNADEGDNVHDLTGVSLQSPSIFDLWHKLYQSENHHRLHGLMQIFQKIDMLFDQGYLVIVKLKINDSKWMIMEFTPEDPEDYDTWLDIISVIVHNAVDARQIKIIYCGIARTDL